MTVEEILTAMQQLIDAATQSGEPMPAEDVARYEELEGKLTAVRKSEELIKRQAAYKSVNVNGVARPEKADEPADEIARAFDSYLRTGRPDQGLIQRAQNEATGSAGGFLVPDGFRQKMVEKRKAFGGVAENVETISTDSGNPLPWPLNDDTDNVGGIVAEGAVVTTGGADLVFSTRALGAYKYGSGGASNLPLKVSWELAQDNAFDLQGFVARKLGERIARAQAADWVVGTGVNEPQGLLSDQGGIGASTALSSNTAPTYDDLVTIIHDLDPAYRDGAVWVFNDAFLEVIRKIQDTSGTGRPLFWDSSMNLGDPMGGLKLLGYPVIIDQACPAPSASNSFGFFGNLKEAYVIRRVKATTMVTLNELYAVNGQIGYLAWERADGMVQDPNAGVLLTAHS
jgi:HK97 family phage major capsid protein